jgi:arsenite transporter
VIVAWWDRHQVALYLAAIVLGAVLGGALPGIAPALERTITPVLALLLFATFLGVPIVQVGRAVRDLRFLAAALAVNFLAVPVLVWGLSRFVADDRGLLLGLLLVLLTPCVDYVIVFTGLAGGAADRLVAVAPVLMLVQLLLLPVFLALIAGPEVVGVVEAGPFAQAFLVLIVLPLTAASVLQLLSRRHGAARRVESVTSAAMVPLMMLTLAVVVGSQIAAVGSRAADLVRLVPLYLVFVLVAAPLGLLAARAARLDVPGTRAVLFSASTRNSLVVLPLALALPTALDLAPLAVVTQTLVELVALVLLVRVVSAGRSVPPVPA